MPSPESENRPKEGPPGPPILGGENNTARNALPLTPTGEARKARKNFLPPNLGGRGGLCVLLLLVLVPIILTAAGRVTSPPAAKGPPVGHILYMEADEPSEHTSLLRGLRELGPDGRERELLHETEPQDVDSGTRTWINQPSGSPDGRWVAVEVQNITIGEEKQSVTYQLWVLPLREPGKPRLLLDITKAKLKPFVGLTWTVWGDEVVFQNGKAEYLVNVHTGAVRYSPGGSLQQDWPIRGHSLQDAWRPGQPPRWLPVQWGWSVWGHRRVTSVRMSPDGRYVAYSVSKPPFENELFYVDTATGKCRQLPVRTGPSAWDWTP